MNFYSNRCKAAAAIALALLLLGHLYYEITGDFRVAYLLKPSHSNNGLGKDLEGIITLLAGNEYSYLGQGNQTYVFVSEEHNTVLKLFKDDYLHRAGWAHVLPPIPPFRSLFLRRGKSKEDRRDKLMRGYTTAYKYDRENSGLLYFHPERTGYPNFQTTLITGLGMAQTIDLNDYVFAVQVKAVTTKKELSTLLSKGNVAGAKERLHQLLDLYFYSYNKALFDNDHNLIVNTGFYGNCAIRQDVGKLVRDPGLITPSFVREDLSKIVDERLSPWLRKKYPNHAPELIADIKGYVLAELEKF